MNWFGAVTEGEAGQSMVSIEGVYFTFDGQERKEP